MANNEEYITEDFVTFEQAKALEELGFDGFKWDCDFWYYYNYVNHDKPIFARCEQVDSYDVQEHWYAPTLAHAQKWLREVKETEAIVNRIDENIYNYTIYGQLANLSAKTHFNFYEQALSAGIDAALELLKQ